MHLIKSFAAILALSTSPVLADGLEIHDAYMRTTGAMARTGAAFFHIMNGSDQDDRLVSVASDLAKRTELHTHVQTAEGVMQMLELEDGLPVAAHSMHALERGGDHVMFMGLTRKVAHGDTIFLTLVFENAGEIVVEVPVDLERKPGQSMVPPADHDHMTHDATD